MSNAIVEIKRSALKLNLTFHFFRMSLSAKSRRRNLPTCRKASQNAIKSERSVIDRINRTNAALVRELEVDQRNVKASSAARRGALRVDAQIDVMIRKVEEKKIDIVTLDRKVRDLEKSIFCMRRVRGGQSASRENSTNIDRQIKVLEGRMGNMLAKCNTIVEENKALRRQIDDRRRQRATNDIIFRNVSQSIVDTKRRTAEVLAHPAFAERAALKSSMAELEATAERENDEFEVAWRGHQESLEWHLIRDLDLDKLRTQFDAERDAAAVDATAAAMGDDATAEAPSSSSTSSPPQPVGFAEVLHRIRPGMSVEELENVVASFEEAHATIASLQQASRQLEAETKREASVLDSATQRLASLQASHTVQSHAAATATQEQRKVAVQGALARFVDALATTEEAAAGDAGEEEGAGSASRALSVLHSVEAEAKRWAQGRR
jgi:hypothetical protein